MEKNKPNKRTAAKPANPNSAIPSKPPIRTTPLYLNYQKANLQNDSNPSLIVAS